MPCFSPAVHELFDRWGKRDILDSLEASHQQLVERRIEAIEFDEEEAVTPRRRTASNCRLLQQVLLHRAERLIASSGTMLLENNIYGLALIIRGHCEATAVLGYFCNRLESLAVGNIKFEEFEWNISDALMGAKHPQFPEARSPLNILTCIEKSDKYFDKHIFEEKKGMLRDCYDWLSDFAHPNFLSNISAFTLDEANHRFVMRHGSDLQEVDFQLPGYLDISARMFVTFFDAFTEKAADADLAM